VTARSAPRGQLDRPARYIDVATVIQSIRDVQGGVADRLREPLAEASHRLCSQFDDELGCFWSPQPRPHDPRHDPERKRNGDSSINRVERRGARIGRKHPRQPHDACRSRDRRRDEKRPLCVASRAAQGPQPVQDEKQHDQREASTGDLLHSVDHVGNARMRRHGQHVTRVWNHERADELPTNSHCVGGGDRDPGHARPGPSFRKRQHELNQQRRPQPLEQEAERPQHM
jgi:hypothetical protein